MMKGFSRRLIVFSTLTVLFVVLFNSLSGDLSPAVASDGPDIDEFVAAFDASPGYINTYFSPDGGLYFEITDEHFDRDFLVVVQRAKTSADFIYWAGWPLGNSMMTFRMVNNKIQLIDKSVIARADEGTPEATMVNRTIQSSVRQAFRPIALNKDEGRYLIDVTSLFVSDWPSLGEFLTLLYQAPLFVDPMRSEVASVKAFPQNVEIEVDLSMAAGRTTNTGIPLPDSKTVPISYHYSILALPEEPMKPRLADDRIGYFTTAYVDFSIKSGPGNLVRLANRWRLEKKDPFAKISEPIKPIVFYIEKSVPTELRPYFKEGVEEWNKAFERAGFKNAILALDEPDDRNWDPGDARYSTTRWVSAPGAGGLAIGPSDVDPRTGEILNADIIFVSSWFLNKGFEHGEQAMSLFYGLPTANEELELMRQMNPEALARMCTYAAGMASQLQLMRLALISEGIIGADDEIPVEYIGEALREIVMHEVGHSIGLRHNFKSSASVPNDHLHDTEFTSEFGLTGSVMDYNPPNIAVDPSQQGHYYSHVVGTYDRWAVEWGYTQVGDEKIEPHPELEAIALEHHKPEYAYGTDEDVGGAFALDPHINTWDLGSDPITYHRDYQAVLDRLLVELDERVVGEGAPYWPLRNSAWFMIYFKFLGRFNQVKAFGGMDITRAHRGDPVVPAPLQLIPADEQRRALEFVLESLEPEFIDGFPKDLLDKMPFDRIPGFSFSSILNRRFTFPLTNIVTALRHVVIASAFAPEVLMRIRDSEYRTDEANPYTLGEHIDGFTGTIWGDVLSGRTEGDPFHRELQNLFIEQLIDMATSEEYVSFFNFSPDAPTPYISDAKNLALAELLQIHDAIESILATGVSSRVDEAHLIGIDRKIEKALDLN